MKTLTTLFFTITFFYSYSQIWNLGTQSCIGGTDVDNIYGSLLLSNGNTLLYGTSTSGISGDKTEAHIGGDDIWLIALDNNQQIVWQKTIGGLLDDRPAKIIETIDHKLMLASYSNSLIGGLKTAPNFGSTDVWLIKMDLTGTIIWDKTYGGTLADGVNDIIELPSKNIIITSSSNSDISGNKLSGNIGLEDTWLLKIDQNGLVLLDKTIGGSNYESGGNLCVTNNSFFYLAVTSFSDISGDKTEAN